MRGRGVGIALAFAAACISGVSVLLNSYAVREFGDATLYTTAKNLVAAAIVIALGISLTAARSTSGIQLPRAHRERIGLVVVGVLGGGIAFALFFQGLAQTSATSAAFIQKSLVIWVAVLAVIVLRERLGALHVGAIALLLIGQAAVSGGLGPIALNTGGAMVLAATLLWSIEVVVAKELLRGLTPLTVASARLGIGVVVLVALAVAGGAVSQLGAVTPQGWLWVAATGVILALYVVTWYSALSRAGAIDVTAVLVFGAVITALLGADIRGSSALPSALGLALITLGCVLIAIMDAERRRAIA
ncbi:MAG TPA: DMT family transporter [Candidatus Limnocylindria bacterium]|nr:DMT family transporter [Candidatus Limnocylindria bacterium]